MLNEEKLKLMTGLALFEKAEGKRLSIANRYYRGDYISRSLLRSFLGYTLCWIVGIAAGVICRIESILAMVDFTETLGYVLGLAGWYAAGLAVYLIITAVVAYRRYRYASRGMKVYTSKLKRLESRYTFPDRAGARKEVKRP